jgi:hypothetical protein
MAWHQGYRYRYGYYNGTPAHVDWLISLSNISLPEPMRLPVCLPVWHGLTVSVTTGHACFTLSMGHA